MNEDVENENKSLEVERIKLVQDENVAVLAGHLISNVLRTYEDTIKAKYRKQQLKRNY